MNLLLDRFYHIYHKPYIAQVEWVGAVSPVQAPLQVPN